MFSVFNNYFEEILYRGIILKRLKNHDNVFSIISSSVLFEFMHHIRFIDTFIAGIMLRYILL
ncbi:membrane protease YdiL (CAAX protease family) [Clostridium tetanomorphum]|uniref:CPBP family intramembrane metalloprotease n=1 Tax=Clostridium tetanomorphum TaxID=1553 RepID=A0A923E7F1_CLOTT|nr:CAAX amino terminal protease [Clostridium tetanomorphum DSM 665]MBC2397922.1 CPBP family intramembrane metalloprotease [Clostridium tetanomorphum]MBP1864761.1 membrane protease YdiL (CAAX protease family) [Clostridium tetanomorphum]NRS83937.1 membrane protease YdiL (CAAX protease family) [Clostridium tetanomorphum]NRZ97156.1 membrane protease YdiL (CAAX protease family) [Clostridium tetanomorphum]